MSFGRMNGDDKAELQNSFENVFGKSALSIKERSKELAKKIYVYGLVISIAVLVGIYSFKIFDGTNVSTVGMYGIVGGQNYA